MKSQLARIAYRLTGIVLVLVGMVIFPYGLLSFPPSFADLEPELLQIEFDKLEVFLPGSLYLGIFVMLVGLIFYMNAESSNRKIRMIVSYIFAIIGGGFLTVFVYILIRYIALCYDDTDLLITKHDLEKMAISAVHFIKENDITKSIKIGDFYEDQDIDEELRHDEFKKYVEKNGGTWLMQVDSWFSEIVIEYSEPNKSITARSFGRDRKPSEDDLVYTIILQKPQKEQPKNIDK